MAGSNVPECTVSENSIEMAGENPSVEGFSRPANLPLPAN